MSEIFKRLPIATKCVNYENGLLYFSCDHEYHPKAVDKNDPLSPNPITAIQTCDNFSPKNDYVKYCTDGIPRICFNCFHATAYLLTQGDLE